ncbi:MAG TPA: S8 family serine peptidase [Lysobacter sp.]|nr:S8 family serine peptidase [Lysobacter sp.]
MTTAARTVTVALATLGFAVSAHAATYVVTAKSATSFDSQLARKIEAAGGRISARLPQIGVAIVESDDPGFATRAARLQGVHAVTPDLVLQFEIPPHGDSIDDSYANPPNSGDNDPRFDLQWGHAAVDAAGAWNRGYRGAGAKVAVLDSGIACQHPDLAPNLLMADSASFIAGEGVCLARVNAFNHGSHVAGTIAAADNGVGVIGVAPEAKIVAVKVLSENTGSGSFAGIIQGIVHAADRGADVINMSLGVRGGLPVNGPGANQVRELVNATARATRYASSRNALVIASAGNDGRDLDKDSRTVLCDSDGANCFNANLRAFPAELPGVLTIAATAPIGWAKAPTSTFLDNLASYSNYGQSAIDFAAPGGDAVYPGNENCTMAGLTRPCWVFDLVLSVGGYSQPVPGGPVLGSYSWAAGTSMAAPHVSGVAALVIGKHGGELAPSEVERILRAAADDLGKPGNDSLYGAGRINAARAVQF